MSPSRISTASEHAEVRTKDKINKTREIIFLANVPRQVSLAGGAGGSQKMGAKALGLLFALQALCLSA